MFFLISKYIFFFFEAEPNTGKRVVGQASLVVLMKDMKKTRIKSDVDFVITHTT